MPKGYRHPTCAERCRIETLKGSGFSRGEIARHPGRDRSTIHRELGRNGGGRGCRHERAQGMAEARRKATSSVPWRFTPELRAEVEEKLREGWSPEQIGGRFRLEGRPVGRQRICERVRADRKAGGDPWKTLRRRGRKPNWKGGRHSGRGHIPDRVDISERPAVVDEKGRLGDREADTIIGKAHGGALVSLVDRAVKCTLLGRVERKTAELVGSTMIELLDEAPAVLTITSDNGKEFAGRTRVAQAHDAEFHFAGPCHSRERGLDEHTDGLMREHFPKGTEFRRVSDAEVQKVQDRPNARPGKAPGYRTPMEALCGLEVKPPRSSILVPILRRPVQWTPRRATVNRVSKTATPPRRVESEGTETVSVRNEGVRRGENSSGPALASVRATPSLRRGPGRSRALHFIVEVGIDNT